MLIFFVCGLCFNSLVSCNKLTFSLASAAWYGVTKKNSFTSLYLVS